jgi:type II secretory pathway component PulF
MAAFAYSGVNAIGVEARGEITAQDIRTAREQLRQRGLRLIELTEVGSAGAGGRRKKVKARSLQVFSRQFATMIDAGLSVVQSLENHSLINTSDAADETP